MAEKYAVDDEEKDNDNSDVDSDEVTDDEDKESSQFSESSEEEDDASDTGLTENQNRLLEEQKRTLTEKKERSKSSEEQRDRILDQEITFEMYKDNAVCANGSMYRKDVRGFLPELMEKIYTDRTVYKKKMLKKTHRLVILMMRLGELMIR